MYSVTTPDVMRALGGGILIGAAAILFLLSTGRVFGVSGILGGLLPPRSGDSDWRVAAVLGLVAGGTTAALALTDAIGAPVARLPLIALAGVLVGFGTRLGNGCTSGHGVCGIGRLSRRSVTATVTFTLAGGATVFLAHMFGEAPL